MQIVILILTILLGLLALEIIVLIGFVLYDAIWNEEYKAERLARIMKNWRQK